MKEQASTSTTTSHPVFMTTFTPEELKNEIQKLLPDKWARAETGGADQWVLKHREL